MRNDRIALVVHPLHKWGGGEYYLKVLSDLYPEAPIYTAWYLPDFVSVHFEDRRIITSYLQKLPLKKIIHQELIPLLPKAYKKFDFSAFDLVLVVSDGFEKNLTIEGKTKLWLHILTPTRFLWLENRAAQQLKKFTFKIYKTFLEKPLHQKWRRIDEIAALHADFITSISNTVAERVQRYYGLASKVIYPPVDISGAILNKDMDSREDWFLYFGRLETYKGVELAIRACIDMKSQLYIAGNGADKDHLVEIVREMNASGQIQFLDFVNDEEKWKLYSRCRALIYPVKDEDFGIVPVEANAAGAPVIAFSGGGVKETIIDKKTGLFFKEYSVKALVEQMRFLKNVKMDPTTCHRQALKFSRKIFNRNIQQTIDSFFQEGENPLR